METPFRRTPLEETHLSLGAKLGPFGGWSMPIEYEGVLAEHRAVRERAGIFDLSHLGKVDVVGADAFAGLQALLTNDLARVGVGRAQYHLLLNPDGGAEEDLIVYRISSERWFVVPNAANTDTVMGAMREVGLDAAALEGWCFLGVQGPASASIVGGLFPEVADMPYFGCAETTFDGTRLVLARTGYTGERGYELFCDSSRAQSLWSKLLELGRPEGMVPCGLGARDVLRLEMGYPLYGQDLDPRHTPLEAGLDRAVAMDKGEFRGREALARQITEGLPSRLRALATDGRRDIPRAHQVVSSGGRALGEITSGTFSPLRGTGIALAYLEPADSVSVGDRLEIDVRGRIATATVVDLPFVDRSPR